MLTVGDVYAAEEAFLTGTAAGVVPIAELDGRALPDAPGSITEALRDAYAATWDDPAYSTELVEVG